MLLLSLQLQRHISSGEKETATCESEGEVAFFSAKRWDGRNGVDFIEYATSCHDAQVMGSYRVSSPICLTALVAKSDDYTTAPQHLQVISLIVSTASMHAHADIDLMHHDSGVICGNALSANHINEIIIYQDHLFYSIARIELIH